MAAEEQTSASLKVSQAVDVFAARLKTHIKDNAAVLSQAESLPEANPEDEEMGGDDYIGAAATLFFIWWRSLERSKTSRQIISAQD